MPPAPVRFSTTTDPCSCCSSSSARLRAAVSTAPPAAMGATSVIVRAGYACACAGRAAPVPETAVAAPSSARKLRRRIYFPYREDRTNIALQGGLAKRNPPSPHAEAGPAGLDTTHALTTLC